VTSALNVARSHTALAAWAPSTGTRYLLAIGGNSADSRGLASIERALILPDGSLSPWEIVAPLPSARNDGLVAQTDDLVVLPGGFRPGGEARVLVAALGPAGLGPWRDAAPLPEPTLGGSALAIGGRIHVTIGNTTGRTGRPRPTPLPSTPEAASPRGAWRLPCEWPATSAPWPATGTEV
jgi:hypothetical protein